MKISVLCKLIAGFLALGLGAVGILLPVWPTTPFVLLAVGCFSATPAIQARILRIPFFKEYYDGYTQKSGLRRRTLVSSLIFLWGMLIVSAAWVQRLPIALLLLAVGCGVTVHLLLLAKPSQKSKTEVLK